jgi:hypothetical protein
LIQRYYCHALKLPIVSSSDPLVVAVKLIAEECFRTAAMLFLYVLQKGYYLPARCILV